MPEGFIEHATSELPSDVADYLASGGRFSGPLSEHSEEDFKKLLGSFIGNEEDLDMDDLE